VLSVHPSFDYSLRETHAVNNTIFANMSKDFDTEEDLHFFAQPYLFEPKHTDTPDNTSAASYVMSVTEAD